MKKQVAKSQIFTKESEIDRRLAEWKRPTPKYTKGWLGLYSTNAASGAEGAIMRRG